MFFDQLGYPWPEHDCDTSWLRDIRRVVETDGSIRVEIAEDISAIRRQSRARRLVHQPPPRPRLIPMEPLESEYPNQEVIEVFGTLYEITQGPTLKRALGLPDTSIVHAFLDGLGPEWGKELGKLTILAPTSSSRIWEEYTALIPVHIVSQYRHSPNVFAVLSGVGPFGKKAWLCSHLSVRG